MCGGDVYLMDILSLVISYLLGSIPTGLLFVRLTTGKDLREEYSGRTGGTNAMRAGGFWVGLFTAIFDFFKATAAVWLAKILTNQNPWIVAAAGVLAVIGHNYSIFLMDRSEGKIRLRGGAGGASTAGASTGIWAPSVLIILPVGLVLLFGVGYASVATMVTGLTATIIFIIRAMNGSGPWAYVYFGIIVEALLLYGLKPNIQRLLQGNERLIGWRARLKRKKEKTREVVVEH
jgi:glycerol-3-phosphate acyltransferase PlsY